MKTNCKNHSLARLWDGNIGIPNHMATLDYSIQAKPNGIQIYYYP